VGVHRVLLPSQISPNRLFETLFMDRVLANPALHIRTSDWPTDIPLEALAALVGPERLLSVGRSGTAGASEMG
jgi:hypothetical protein